MLKKIMAIAGAGALMVSPAGAKLSDTAINDVDCLTSLSLMIGEASSGAEKDKEAEDAMTVILLYYLGRIRGHSPNLDLETAIVYRLGTFVDKPTKVYKVGGQCAEDVEAEGQALERIGNKLENLGK